MIKSFSGLVVFCFAILRTISAYVGANWLSQYILREKNLKIDLLYKLVKTRNRLDWYRY